MKVRARLSGAFGIGVALLVVIGLFNNPRGVNGSLPERAVEPQGLTGSADEHHRYQVVVRVWHLPKANDSGGGAAPVLFFTIGSQSGERKGYPDLKRPVEVVGSAREGETIDVELSCGTACRGKPTMATYWRIWVAGKSRWRGSEPGGSVHVVRVVRL